MDAFIRCSLKKRTPTGILEKDKRGKHVPANKLVAENDTFMRHHITSFKMESHYCRKKSTKKYLDSALNITIMHRMYVDLCSASSRKPVSLEKYRLVFNEYNLGFFKPKKDQCKRCLVQRSRSEDEQKQYEVEFNKHLERKESARKC
ncbi:hypothetical protein QE152_g13466 [Popillia japonica]|uniref:Uncharacterized protein n=1 Tax=Popillia japonica TaxID=7064 RepID=A0AAW1L9M7_POPJA